MKGRRFLFTVEPDLYEPLKAQARKERRSIGSLLNWLVAKYLEEEVGIEVEMTIEHGGDRKSKAISGKGKSLVDLPDKDLTPVDVSDVEVDPVEASASASPSRPVEDSALKEKPDPTDS